ncbi:unnamed protein product, partial [marine sediment metagenome]
MARFRTISFQKKSIAVTFLTAVFSTLIVLGLSDDSRLSLLVPALAQNSSNYSPTGIVPDRDVYYPGTEPLAQDEMRVVALGTGQPSPRPKQAAA